MAQVLRVRTHRILCAATVLVLSLASPWLLAEQPDAPCDRCAVWNAPQEPFKIYGNSYYVGTHGLSSILITSKKGHVLIDGDLKESVPQIVAHIRALGFRVEDVKLILNSHVHFDHAGGIAELQRLTGARVLASSWSAAVMNGSNAGRDDPQYGLLPTMTPLKRVESFHDGQTLRVGNIELTAHLTPGHTPGGTSWTWKSCEEGRCVNIVYADSLTAVSAPGFKFSSSDHAPLLAGFQKSFAFLEAVPCDILITTHPEISGLWDRLQRRSGGSSPDPMIDSGACRDLAKSAREQLQKRIAEETSH
jgi:metallo-beta-lactamase class B